MSVTAFPPAEKAVRPLPGTLTIRPETPDDADWIEELHALCFGPGRYARAAFRVRERFATDPGLCRVAELGERPVSSVRLTPISLSGLDGYLLGPLATDPAYRGLGAARALVHDVCTTALARQEGRFVLLVGDFSYYGPLGFVRTTRGTITFPGPVDPDRILVMTPETNLPEMLAGPVAAFGER